MVQKIGLSSTQRVMVWRMEEDSLHFDKRHSHCEQCFSFNCHINSKSSNSCEMLICELGCGMRFHACKLCEHSEICKYQFIQCLNKEYGCPITLQRHKLAYHLVVCPANVIVCTMEWNRWPAYTKNGKVKLPVKEDHLQSNQSQLDIMLALRDQRILNQSKKTPKHIRKMLQNGLTEHFPAVPIHVDINQIMELDFSSKSSDSENVFETDPKAPWNIAKNPPGLKSSLINVLNSNSDCDNNILHEVCSKHKQENPNKNIDNSEETLNQNYIDKNQNLTEFSDLKNKLDTNFGHYITKQKNENADMSEIQSVNGGLINGAKKLLDENDVTNSSIYSPSSRVSIKQFLCLNLDIECLSKNQAKPKSMYTFLCAQELRRDEYEWHFKNVHCDIHSGLNGWLEQRCPLFRYGCMFSMRRLYPNKVGSQITYDNCLESFAVLPSVNLINSENYVKKISTLQHVRLINTAKKEIHPKKIYVNGKLYKPINKFEETVLQENERNMDISNGEVETFFNGIKSDDNTGDFCSLPYEVLLNIIEHLDSFSLNKFSMTNSFFRNLCSTVLHKKGIVTFRWKKQSNRPTKWEVSQKIWRFSTAFSPITEWGYEKNASMGQHLKDCSYFEKIVSKTPYSYEKYFRHSYNFERIMIKMYPDFKLRE